MYPLNTDSIKFFWLIIIECFKKSENNKKPKATKKNLKARAAKGSLLSIIGLVVIKADDQSNINISGKILTISGFIEHLFLLWVFKFS